MNTLSTIASAQIPASATTIVLKAFIKISTVINSYVMYWLLSINSSATNREKQLLKFASLYIVDTLESSVKNKRAR